MIGPLTTYSFWPPNPQIVETDQLELFRTQLSPLASQFIRDDLLSAILSGSLEKLSLEKCPINDQDLQLLLSYCKHLTHLDLSEATFLTNEGLKSISKDIQHLSLRGLPLLTEEILDELLQYSSLETVDFSQNHFSMTQLSKLQTLPNLNRLFLWQCRQLRDDDLLWVRNRAFQHLDLSYCTSLTDECLPFLSQSKVLNLDGINFITTMGIASLNASIVLEKISLANCPHVEVSKLPSSLQDKMISEISSQM